MEALTDPNDTVTATPADVAWMAVRNLVKNDDNATASTQSWPISTWQRKYTQSPTLMTSMLPEMRPTTKGLRP